jgi:hypothetical protein
MKSKNIIKPKKASAKNTIRLPNPKLDLSRLLDAVIDGVFTVPVGGELLVVKKRDGKMMRSLCVVKKIGEDTIDTFDETKQQWFSFELSKLSQHDVIIKSLSIPTV